MATLVADPPPALTMHLYDPQVYHHDSASPTYGERRRLTLIGLCRETTWLNKHQEINDFHCHSFYIHVDYSQHCMMHKCIMVKLGGNEKHRKSENIFGNRGGGSLKQGECIIASGGWTPLFTATLPLLVPCQCQSRVRRQEEGDSNYFL